MAGYPFNRQNKGSLSETSSQRSTSCIRLHFNRVSPFLCIALKKVLVDRQTFFGLQYTGEIEHSHQAQVLISVIRLNNRHYKAVTILTDCYKLFAYEITSQTHAFTVDLQTTYQVSY